jgi:FkbH-like protein
MTGSMLRQEIETAISCQEWDTAIRALRAYFLRQPNMASGQYVLSKINLLPEYKKPKETKLAIARSFSIEPAASLLQAAAWTYGINLNIRVGDFNTYAQDILDPDSGMYQFNPQIVLLAVQTRDLLPQIWSEFTNLSVEELDVQIQNVLSNFDLWIRKFRSNSKAHLIIQSFEIPPIPSAGVLDDQKAKGQKDAIREINQGIKKIARSHKGVYVFDYDSLVARHGYDFWHDEYKWLTARMPVSANCLIYLANEYLRFIVPLAGKTAKALVMDLDNTLWGGIIGEEGINGIILSPEYPGFAYTQLQRAILDLYERGIILAVCSKNNLPDVTEVFDKHPNMLLQQKHFGAMRINWSDKAQNLREIAEELNIGIDSLVFLDDNPVEREGIRSSLPDVSVIELPEDPMLYAKTLRDFPLFEKVSLSEEDRQRGRYYSEDRERKKVQESSGTLHGFYHSLEMVVTFSRVNPATLSRTAQLTQKTNQFNLTTKRYSEQEILEKTVDPAWQVLNINLRDKFGDSGQIGVAILHIQEDICEIDTLLLSCRVIGRTVETALLTYIAQQGISQGAKKIRGWFVPTAKNQPAKAFFSEHGFTQVKQDGASTLWEYDLSRPRLDYPEWIHVEIQE